MKRAIPLATEAGLVVMMIAGLVLLLHLGVDQEREREGVRAYRYTLEHPEAYERGAGHVTVTDSGPHRVDYEAQRYMDETGSCRTFDGRECEP